jgi:hypothetical protein
MFCTVGNNVIFTSDDGKNWKTYSLNGDWNAVGWSQELNVLICVSNSVLGYSFDGVLWNSKNIPNSFWKDVCWSKELGIFIIASDDKIMISKYVKKFD